MGLKHGFSGQLDEPKKGKDTPEGPNPSLPVNPGLITGLTKIEPDEIAAPVPALDLTLEFNFTVELEDGSTVTVLALNYDDAWRKAEAAGLKVKSVKLA